MANQPIIVQDMTPLWDVLDGLGWHDIPEDLSEIDENWCFNRVVEYCAGELEELAYDASWEFWAGCAYDLRDLWHTARAENAEFRRGWW
ncbi:MAG: hypothetical protein ACO3NK_17085 [Prochlorotrichaceae cyanobacterium]